MLKWGTRYGVYSLSLVFPCTSTSLNFGQLAPTATIKKKIIICDANVFTATAIFFLFVLFLCAE